MPQYLKSIFTLTAFAFLFCWLGHPAQAAEEIVLTSDQSQIVKLPEPPATIIVGNPSVADITTEGATLVLHPRGFGLTNLVALDSKGKKLADYRVRVIYEDSYSVAMYSPDGRETYACRKDCEPTLRIGDNNTYFNRYIAQARSKNSLAYGQALGEELLTRNNYSNSSLLGIYVSPY